MAELILGRLKFHWKGDWTSSTDFIKDDVVKYGPSVYVCVENHTSTEDFDFTKFELMSEGITWAGEWTSGKYQVNDIVSYGGAIYVCIQDHDIDISSDTSPNSIELWERLVGGLEWENNWSPTQEYQRGDIVKFGGHTYVATQTTPVDIEPIDTNYWDLLAKGYRYVGAYNQLARYLPGDLVKYGARIYACETASEANVPTDTNFWFLFADGLEWNGVWDSNSADYTIGDVVSYGGASYVCILGHSSGIITPTNSTYWNLIVQGQQWTGDWSDATNYVVGDIVKYGARTYICISDNTNQIPINTNYWELLTDGFSWQDVWSPSAVEYKIGDVVRYGARSYVCIAGHISSSSLLPTDTGYWNLVNKGLDYKNAWQSGNEYKLDDVVEYSGSSYVCIQAHDVDQIPSSSPEFWSLLSQGDISSPMTETGDIIYREAGGNIERLPIGPTGSFLTVQGGIPSWGHLTPQNDYYVSPQGDDTNDGRTPTTSWRTIRHACDETFGLGQVRINVQAGVYEEQTPIRVGRSVVLEGNGLGAVTISPNNDRDEGFGVGISDDGSTPNANAYLFLMNNGARMRNFVFKGFSTDSVIVSLDPGYGPDDTSVWITSQSPYVQNCTSFTPGGTGFKIDGSLHNGGYKSMVANDWTQINSDGIGIHVLNDGRSEIVSCFTYYCHIGYLAESGGKIRAIVGNNSYGEFGAVARGFSQLETPLTGKLRLNDKTIDSITSLGPNVHIFTAYRDEVGNRFFVGHTNPTGTDVTSTFDSTASYPVIAKFNSAGSLDWIYTYESAFGAIHSAVELSDRIYCGGVIVDGGTNKGFILAISKAGEIQWQKTIGDTTEIVDVTADENNLYAVGIHSTSGMAVLSTNPAGLERWASTLEYNDSSATNSLVPTSTTFAGTPTTSVDTYALAGDATAEDNLYIAAYDSTVNESLIIRLDNNGAYITAYQYGDVRISSLDLDTGNGDGIYLMAAGYYNPPTAINRTPLAFRLSVDGVVQWQTQATAGTEDGEFTDVIALGNDIYLSGYINEGANNNSTGLVARYTSNGTSVWFRTLDNLTNNISFNGVMLDGVNVITSGIEQGNALIANIQRDLDGGIGTVESGSYSLNTVSFTVSNDTVVTQQFNEIDSTGVALGSADTTLSLNQSPTQTRSVLATRQGFAGIGTGVAFTIDSLNRQPKDGSVLQILGDNETYFVIGVANFIDKTVTTGNYSSAQAILSANKEFLQKEVIGWIEDQIANNTVVFDGFTYNQQLCERDIGYIVDALISDLDENTNAASIDAAIRYYENASGLKAITDQKAQTLAAIDYLKSIIDEVLDQIAVNPSYAQGVNQTTGLGSAEVGSIPLTENNIQAIYDTINNGLSAAPSKINYGTCQISIDPAIPSNKTPNDGTFITFREAFSQVRMSGHDFLDIGTGGFADTNYPVIIASDYTQPPNQDREVVSENGGRVFYVTTDQDGNFRVGDYFKVEQATGRATLSSEEFDLAGLNELQLGSITAGKQGATINEFSTDGTFADNSDTSVPTEKAVKTYVDQEISRLSETAGKIVAGVAPTQSKVEVTGSGLTTDSIDFDIAGVEKFKVADQFILVPRGTTAERPGTPLAGYVRYNTDVGALEVYQGNAWVPAGGLSNNTVNSGDSPYTASAFQFLWVDTSGGAVTISLPSVAQIGDEIRFLDVTGTFDTNNLTIARNGHNIQGSASDLTVSTERAGFALVYYNATQGWLLKDR